MTTATSTRMAKKQRFRSAKQQFARASPLLIAHFFAVTTRLRCENAYANFMFCGWSEHKTATFFFFSWTLIESFRIKIQRKLPTFDELSAIKFEAVPLLTYWFETVLLQSPCWLHLYLVVVSLRVPGIFSVPHWKKKTGNSRIAVVLMTPLHVLSDLYTIIQK